MLIKVMSTEHYREEKFMLARDFSGYTFTLSREINFYSYQLCCMLCSFRVSGSKMYRTKSKRGNRKSTENRDNYHW